MEQKEMDCVYKNLITLIRKLQNDLLQLYHFNSFGSSGLHLSLLRHSGKRICWLSPEIWLVGWMVGRLIGWLVGWLDC